jgi:hypothetical protein
MQLPLLLLIVNLAATLYMVGLIWVVQIVHYPLFSAVGAEHFVVYQKRHQILMTFVVGPPMLIEAFSSVFLAWYPPPGVSLWMIFAGIGLVFVIWISTAAIQVPCHGKLEAGFDPIVHRRLVRSNWIRTVAWTTRGALMIWMFLEFVAVK